MAWVKEEVQSTADIFLSIINKRPSYRGELNGSGSPYEYWSDYIKDYYDVTLEQCDDICKRLKDYYKIKNFYRK